MSVKSISGISLSVTNLQESVDFYHNLGMRIGKQDETSATLYVNWFWIELRHTEHPQAPLSTSDLGVQMKVDSVQEFHQWLHNEGYAPESEPTKQPNGRKEFVLRDPDGNRLVFFE